MDKDTDFNIDWGKYPNLKRVFTNLGAASNVFYKEFTALLRDARADAVRFIEDAKADELRKAYERRGRKVVPEEPLG